IVPDDHHLSFTCAAGFELWPRADVLLGIGSRLELQWFRWPGRPPGPSIVNVDIDPEQVDRIRPAVPVVADARAAVRALLEAVPEAPRRASRRDEFEAVRQRTLERIRTVTPHIEFLAAI